MRELWRADTPHMRSIKRMKSTQDIVDSIDSRLQELTQEINTLSAARSALDAPAHEPLTQPSRRAIKRGTRATSASPRTRPSASSPREISRKASRERTARSRDRTPAKARPAARRAAVAITPERLESLLSENGGLTTSQLAERANGNRDHVLRLLRDLETAGQIRRTGQRRGTRWHAITDEDRIRQRVAELEASRKSPA
jgi:DNA-binding MarR family transcriptional regulator